MPATNLENIYASIITIGDELLIGQTIDTNSAYIAQQLNLLGILVKHRVAVADNASDIVEALRYESSLSNLIIITGGLGPTSDDITKPTLCKYFNSNLESNKKVLDHITIFFEKRNRKMIDSNIAQANVPHNCEVLFNTYGTAPGMLFMQDQKMYISLPGVPLEMKTILEQYGFSKIKAYFQTNSVQHLSMSTAGKGESFIAVLLQDFEKELPQNIKLAYLPKLGALTLRLTGTNTNEVEMQKYFNKLHQAVHHYCYALADESLAETILKIFTKNNITLSLAESCTGGAIADALTNISGSSNYFSGSITSYTNFFKTNILEVDTQILQEHTAVSEATAIAMAKQILAKSKTTFALAITGFLETQDTHEPHCWLAVCNANTHKTIKLPLPYARIKNKELATNLALNFLRVFVLDECKNLA